MHALALHDDTNGAFVDISAAGFDCTGRMATWDTSALGLGPAFYTAILAGAGLCDEAGNDLDGDGDGAPGGDCRRQFLVACPGDVTLDGVVDHLDYLTVKRYLGGPSDGHWWKGDFDADGDVDRDDLRALEAGFGRDLRPSAPVAASAPVSTPTPDPGGPAAPSREEEPVAPLPAGPQARGEPIRVDVLAVSRPDIVPVAPIDRSATSTAAPAKVLVTTPRLSKPAARRLGPVRFPRIARSLASDPTIGEPRTWPGVSQPDALAVPNLGFDYLHPLKRRAPWSTH